MQRQGRNVVNRMLEQCSQRAKGKEAQAPQAGSEAVPAAALMQPAVAEAGSQSSSAASLLQKWRMGDLRAYSSLPQGWGASMRWSAVPLALVAAGGLAELAVLPVVAPGGVCTGTVFAETAFAVCGVGSDLRSLLSLSDGLEGVQVFSLLRKLGQVFLLDTVLRGVLGGNKPREVFGINLARPLEAPHGWFWWACVACGGLAAVNCGAQSLGSLLPTGTASEAELQAQPLLRSNTGGDIRTLPFRCRLWLESCVAAPYLEEVFFRGFLLTALAGFMPVWGAIGVSSAAFGIAHASTASLEDLPRLTALGVVLGVAFVRGRGLTAPFVAHGFNNTLQLIKETEG